MISRVTLSAVLAGILFLPGCVCISWQKYKPTAPPSEEGTFEDDFGASIEPTHSGFSAFILNTGPPYSLHTVMRSYRPFEWYSIDSAELEWADGHRETLAIRSEGYRAAASRPRSLSVAELNLPRTFHHVPAEGTVVTLRMRVTLRDASGTHVHHLTEKYRFTHQKGCEWITFDDLMGV